MVVALQSQHKGSNAPSVRNPDVDVCVVCVMLMVTGGKGDVTLSADDENLLKLMTGQLNPQKVYFQLILSC